MPSLRMWGKHKPKGPIWYLSTLWTMCTSHVQPVPPSAWEVQTQGFWAKDVLSNSMVASQSLVTANADTFGLCLIYLASQGADDPNWTYYSGSLGFCWKQEYRLLPIWWAHIKVRHLRLTAKSSQRSILWRRVWKSTLANLRQILRPNTLLKK